MDNQQLSEGSIQMATISSIIQFMLDKFKKDENLTYENYTKKFDGQRIFADGLDIGNKDNLIAQFLYAVDALAARDFATYNKQAIIYSFSHFPVEIFKNWCEKRRIIESNYLLELNVPKFSRTTDCEVSLKRRLRQWERFATYLQSD